MPVKFVSTDTIKDQNNVTINKRNHSGIDNQTHTDVTIKNNVKLSNAL